MVWGLKPLGKILRNFKTFSAVESNMNISYFLALFSQHVQVSLVFHSIQLTFYLPENLRFMGSNPLRTWNFFRYYFNYWFSSVYSCEDLLYSFLHRSAHTWFSYIYKLKIPFFKRKLICNLLFFCALQKSASSFNLCCWSSRMPRCRFGTNSNELNFTDIEKDYEKIEQQVL